MDMTVLAEEVVDAVPGTVRLPDFPPTCETLTRGTTHRGFFLDKHLGPCDINLHHLLAALAAAGRYGGVAPLRRPPSTGAGRPGIRGSTGTGSGAEDLLGG